MLLITALGTYRDSWFHSTGPANAKWKKIHEFTSLMSSIPSPITLSVWRGEITHSLSAVVTAKCLYECPRTSTFNHGAISPAQHLQLFILPQKLAISSYYSGNFIKSSKEKLSLDLKWVITVSLRQVCRTDLVLALQEVGKVQGDDDWPLSTSSPFPWIPSLSLQWSLPEMMERGSPTETMKFLRLLYS